MRLFIWFSMALFSLFSNTACLNNDKEEQPKTPIFSGLSDIELTGPNTGVTNYSGSLTYNAPGTVKYIIVGVFNAPITTSGTTITNPQNFQYGSRTGLSDFFAGSQSRSSMHSYNQSTKNFNSGNSSPSGAGYYWAVWGYDAYGNLTHCSPQRQVGFP